MKTIKITVSYRFKGTNLVSTNTTSDESYIPQYIEIGEDEIQQYLRESILDECLGWERAYAKEEKVFAHYEKNKVIQITEQ
jgi:hypothetical protein